MHSLISITPQNEVPEYLSKCFRTGKYLSSCESEIAAANGLRAAGAGKQ